VIVSKSVAHYAVRLVRETRPQETDRDYVKHYLTWGAGPRACQSLLLGAKARALLDGRPHVSLDDVRTLAKPVLRHRIVTSFAAESENINPDDVVDQIVADLPETV
jgi:MoxR-like ATPase